MKNEHLPLFGVGPAYVTGIIFLTVLGIYLSSTKRVPFIGTEDLKYTFLVLGAFFIGLGIFLWVKAGIFSKVDDSIKKNQLLKTGIYAYVRNPVYSAFMFICKGIIFIYSNITLMGVPLVYWLFMTVLMKNTEEKWLFALYGQEYISYCHNVNRCIPWITKNR